ncbi:MAG: SurA N-terminal domain-containing protein, partial [Saprospiraceae bacterium]|nr:SurA N-terminal domain-containing protein [Saprospiraceae bacterium]
MALIGTIRKNGWNLIALMTLALGGFILMEIISNSQRNSAGDVNSLGKVNGTEIKRGEFDDYEKLVYANSKSSTFQVRSQFWDYFVDRAIVNQEAETLGLGVDGEELKELEFGPNPSEVVAERFKGADGQINRQQLAGIKSAIEGGQFTDPMNRAYWATQEKEIIKDRLESKIIGLVTKGMYTP